MKQTLPKLRERPNQLFDVQRYVVLSFDEMKIQPNLVFDKQQLTHLIIIDFIYHLWQKNYSGITNLKVLKIYN